MWRTNMNWQHLEHGLRHICTVAAGAAMRHALKEERLASEIERERESWEIYISCISANTHSLLTILI